MSELTFNPTIDSAIGGITSPDENHGSDTTMTIGTLYLGGMKSQLWRAIFNFDLSALAGLYTSIDAAQLELNAFEAVGGGVGCKLFRCTRPSTWTELGVTWNKYDGTNLWTAAGGDWDATTPTPVAFTMPSATGAFTVTGLLGMVNDAIANRASIVSLIGLLDDESDTGITHRLAVFSGEDSGGRWPVLRVTYTPSGPPPGADRRRGRWP